MEHNAEMQVFPGARRLNNSRWVISPALSLELAI
jgi:hypothetical protein